MAAAATAASGLIPPTTALSDFGMFMSRSQNKPYWQRLDTAGRPTGGSTWQPPAETVALLSGNFWRPLTAFTKSEDLVKTWNAICSSVGAGPLEASAAQLPLSTVVEQLLASFGAVVKRSMWAPTARAFCVPDPPVVLGPFKLLRLKEPASPGPVPGLVSVSVFSFTGAYRRPDRYASGLLALAAAVATHLPQWTLRIYADMSVTCGPLLSALHGAPMCAVGGVHSTLGSCTAVVEAAWSEAWGKLLQSEHVEIVWWEAPTLMAESKAEHLDCVGTFARMLPMVAGPKPGAASWAGAPPANTPVLCTDADFGAFGQEIGILRMAAWVGAQTEASRPAVLGLSPAGSPAERHQPSLGLPDMLAGSVLVTQRFPASWLWEYLAAAAEGGVLSLAAEYTRAQQRLEAAKGGEGGGRFSKCTSSFSYGVDELWMTRVLKGGAVLQDPPSNWWWVQLPNVDRAFGRAVDLLSDTIAAVPSAATSGPIIAAAAALATAAGDSTWGAAAGAGGGVADIGPRASQHKWTRSVAQKAGLYTRTQASDVHCSVPAFDAGACGKFGTRLLAAMKLVGQAAAASKLKVTPTDVQSLVSTVAQLTAALASSGALVSVAQYTLGGGQVAEHHPPQEKEVEASLMQYLCTGVHQVAALGAPALAPAPAVGGVKRPRA